MRVYYYYRRSVILLTDLARVELSLARYDVIGVKTVSSLADLFTVAKRSVIGAPLRDVHIRKRNFFGKMLSRRSAQDKRICVREINKFQKKELEKSQENNRKGEQRWNKCRTR